MKYLDIIEIFEVVERLSMHLEVIWTRLLESNTVNLSHSLGLQSHGRYYQVFPRYSQDISQIFGRFLKERGAIQFRNGYERTGEITYLRDALKWAARYFINIHPGDLRIFTEISEPNKLIGQVGNSVTDSQYCGPSEFFNLTRDVYWVIFNLKIQLES